MAVLNLLFPFDLVSEIEDYSKIFNEILDFNISVNILKFSTGIDGLNLLIDIPDEKVNMITKTLKNNNVIIEKNGEIIFLSKQCIHCGACISLCPNEALYFNKDYEVKFSEKKCIGCLFCVEGCPVKSIKRR